MIWKIAISVIVCWVVAGLGAVSTADAILNWYPTLNKPFFNPPSWIFGPMWSILYTMMGIAFGMVWHQYQGEKYIKSAMIIFGVQLVLNAFWSPVFFGMQQPLIALFIIVTMLFFIWKTIKAFRPINRNSAFLLYPYLAWVSFATLLNASIVYLN